MKHYSKILLCAALFIVLQTAGQEGKPDAENNSQFRKQLKMDDDSYKSFMQKLGGYNKKILKNINDTSLNKTEQKNKADQLRAERKIFIEETLSKDQQKVLAEFERSFSSRSPAKKLIKAQEEKLKKRGMKLSPVANPESKN
jgi:hypothetical protein